MRKDTHDDHRAIRECGCIENVSKEYASLRWRGGQDRARHHVDAGDGERDPGTITGLVGEDAPKYRENKTCSMR